MDSFQGQLFESRWHRAKSQRASKKNWKIERVQIWMHCVESWLIYALHIPLEEPNPKCWKSANIQPQSLPIGYPNGLTIPTNMASVSLYHIIYYQEVTNYLGYSLCDNSVGVLYNDSTRIVLHEDGDKLQYVDKDFRETFCTVRDHPSELKKKVSLVDYFRKYMNEHLLKVRLICYVTITLLLHYITRFLHVHLGWCFSSSKRRRRHFAIASVANLVPNAICNLSLAIRRLHADQLVWGKYFVVPSSQLFIYFLVSRKADILPPSRSYNWAETRWQYCDLQERLVDETWFHVEYEWKIPICSTYGQEAAIRKCFKKS